MLINSPLCLLARFSLDYPKTMKRSFVYILASKTGTLYIGVTSDLARRVYEHKLGLIDGFTATYRVNQLIYFEEATSILDAIAREKQIKGWRRSKKMELVRSTNPNTEDLSGRFLDGLGMTV